MQLTVKDIQLETPMRVGITRTQLAGIVRDILY